MNRKRIFTIELLLVLISACFLFIRIGHYSFWDDEAVVALSAKAILKTGDTSAFVDDHNVVAYRNGVLLHNGKDRSTPPLPAYITALTFKLLGQTTWAARLPFAFAGFCCILVIVRWLHRLEPTPWIRMAFVIAILGNISLFLFLRQCRYYALAILCSTVITYLYVQGSRTRREGVVLTFCGIVLFASNYMNFFALYAMLALDYLLWGRKLRPISFRQVLVPFVIQLLCCTAIFAVWNPLQTGNSAALFSFGNKTWLCFLNFTDLIACEFGVGLLLIAAPIVAVIYRDLWLLRSWCALVVYVASVSLVSPQVMAEYTGYADVRYIAPAIPLCIFIGVRTIWTTLGRWPWVALAVACVAFLTNALQGVTLRPYTFHSCFLDYITELRLPPPEPYQPTAAWLRENVKAGQSVWVLPREMTYPLMFHAPKPTYGWQLSSPIPEDLKDLNPVLYQGKIAPDFIVVFGPQMTLVTEGLQTLPQMPRYTEITKFDVFWDDLYRPELYWRTFKPLPRFDHNREIIRILKKQ